MRVRLILLLVTVITILNAQTAEADYESKKTAADITQSLALHKSVQASVDYICAEASDTANTISNAIDGLFKDAKSLAAYAYSMGANVSPLTTTMRDSATTLGNQIHFYSDTSCPSPAPIQFSELAVKLGVEVTDTAILLSSQLNLINQASQSIKMDNYGGLNPSLNALKKLKIDVESLSKLLLAESWIVDQLEKDYAIDAQYASALIKKKSKSKKISISCIKGNSLKTVSAVKPVCPTGYRKK